MMNTFHAKTREDWRNWLEKNHSIAKEVWLVYYKKHTGKLSVSYKCSVEEAICFGWIDGIKKRINDEQYAHRFTARKTKSKWSPLNIEIAEQMIKANKMTSAGLTAFRKRIEYDREIMIKKGLAEVSLDPNLEQVLKNNAKAWHNFVHLAPGYKKQMILWIESAKKEATKKKRLKEVISLLEQNRKLGLK